ncbi:MAG TPA: PadR family transcriptional regulator [Casimicrobiaceae bacterium]|nr:PadR family transcriptional regulator [Casimicrobiaceae bacterium]
MHCSKDRFSRGRWHFGAHGHHGRRSGALFGGTGGRGFGWHGFRAGRKLGSDDLQLLILALLVEKPYHGYEIIKALEERSGGFYSPSPGMVYPALTYLEELGHASVEAEGAKKLYRITDPGRAHLERNRRIVDAIFTQLEWVGAKMDRVRKVFVGEEAREADDVPQGWSPELAQARRELRKALARLGEASAEEQRRAAAILERAAREIRGGS